MERQHFSRSLVSAVRRSRGFLETLDPRVAFSEDHAERIAQWRQLLADASRLVAESGYEAAMRRGRDFDDRQALSYIADAASVAPDAPAPGTAPTTPA